jgi:choline dehydrogenase-like flavoprotein
MVEASMMPLVTSATTRATVLAIAERAADWLSSACPSDGGGAAGRVFSVGRLAYSGGRAANTCERRSALRGAWSGARLA